MSDRDQYARIVKLLGDNLKDIVEHDGMYKINIEEPYSFDKHGSSIVDAACDNPMFALHLARLARNAGVLSDETCKNIKEDVSNSKRLKKLNGHFGLAHDPNKTFNRIRDTIANTLY